MKRFLIRTIAIGCILSAAGFVVDDLSNIGFFVKESQARIGRPLTPMSVAGVARRTTRRVIRRTTVYAATLPKGCTKVNIDGTILYVHQGTYYQPYGNKYVVVTVS
jgi:hypothetical protein